MGQANAVVEGAVQSQQVSEILEAKLEVFLGKVVDRLKEIRATKETIRQEKLDRINNADDSIIESESTPKSEEHLKLNGIVVNISSYLENRDSLLAPQKEQQVRKLLEEIKEYFQSK